MNRKGGGACPYFFHNLLEEMKVNEVDDGVKTLSSPTKMVVSYLGGIPEIKEWLGDGDLMEEEGLGNLELRTISQMKSIKDKNQSRGLQKKKGRKNNLDLLADARNM